MSLLFVLRDEFTMSPDQKGIETDVLARMAAIPSFTMSPDQKGIETIREDRH